MDIENLIKILFSTPNQQFGTNVLGPLEPLLVQFLRTTPEGWTTANTVIYGAWGTMLAVANAFFILFFLAGVIQIMISQSTGTLAIPLEQFVPRAITTALMMNLSFFFCRVLLQFNNLLCGVVNGNLDSFFQTVNNGSRITLGQGLVLYYAIIILLNIGLIRLLLQAFERLVLWNLLFVLSPIAFLCAFLPIAAPAFAFWGRMFVVVTFTQFLQFLAFMLGVALFTSAGNGAGPLVQLLMAVAMLYLVAKIPALIGRFPSMGVNASQGVGQVIGSVLLFARLIAA
jgi:hypothetical protein